MTRTWLLDGVRADELVQSNASSGKFSKVSIIYIKMISFTGILGECRSELSSSDLIQGCEDAEHTLNSKRRTQAWYVSKSSQHFASTDCQYQADFGMARAYSPRPLTPGVS